jgi:Zn-dependent M28 family amino/carboxypeptidase
MQTEATTIEPVLERVSTDLLMEYTANISQWVRLSGSEDEAKAFDYIERTLQSWGLTTQRYAPLSLTSWPISASIVVNGEAFRCITHSFSTSTGPEGMTAEVVYAGAGTRAELEKAGVSGKIALVDGPGSPNKAVAAEGTGAVGVIHVNPGEQIKEMILSPVWGSPNTDNIDDLPTLPHVSVNGASGKAIKALLENGPVTATMTTEVDTSWRELPALVANVAPATPSDDFVLLSGHVDSWHHGALDNGTADASAMESVRVINELRDNLTRGVRVAFWSGHSHARYAASAWYADEFFVELHEHCVAHVNIDMPGAKNATILSDALTMGETYGLAKGLIAEIAQQELTYNRMSRMGDQSFWGVGFPSLYVSLSSVDDEGTMEWYHTPLDTMEYIDPELLTRDAKILASTVYRLAADKRLPIDQTGAVTEIIGALDDIAAESNGAVDLAPVKADAERLLALAKQLNESQDSATFNRAAMRVSRLLMPVNYTVNGPFVQDPALSAPSLPGLRSAVDLGKLPNPSPEHSLLEVNVRRERNRVQVALRDAAAVIESALAG